MPVGISQSPSDHVIDDLLATFQSGPHLNEKQFKRAKRKLISYGQQEILTESQRTKICSITNRLTKEEKRYKWERRIKPSETHFNPPRLFELKFYPTSREELVLETLNEAEQNKLFSCMNKNPPALDYADVIEPVENAQLLHMLEAASQLNIPEVYERLLKFFQDRFRNQSPHQFFISTSYTNPTTFYELAKYCPKDCEEIYCRDFFAWRFKPCESPPQTLEAILEEQQLFESCMAKLHDLHKLSLGQLHRLRTLVAFAQECSPDEQYYWDMMLNEIDAISEERGLELAHLQKRKKKKECTIL